MQIIGAIKSQGYGIITQDFKNTCDFYSKKNSGSNEDVMSYNTNIVVESEREKKRLIF